MNALQAMDETDHIGVMATITAPWGDVETVYAGSVQVWAWRSPGALAPWKRVKRAELLAERTFTPRGWRVAFALDPNDIN